MNHEKLRADALASNTLIMASIELTEVCNLSCAHCYIPKEKSELSLESAKAVIDKLYQLGVLYLTFTGGEIFSYSPFREVYLYAKSKGFIISLMTNGTLINNRIKKLLKAYKPYNVSITVYGLTPQDYIHFTGKDSYKELIDGLDFFESSDIPFSLKTVLVKANYSKALRGDYEALALRYNTSMVYDPIIFGKKDGDTSSIEQRLTADEIIQFENSMDETIAFWKKAVLDKATEPSIRCGGGLSSLSIDSNGNVAICSLFVTEKCEFLTSSPEELKQFLLSTHSLMQKRFEQSPCFSCEKKSLCRWCSAYANLEHGSGSEAIHFFCELAERRVDCFG
ncbi:radical SAM protein [uncultured Shewanella sp.]|uniref:radical SAM protein n=1 Tax=uncultured Shewanella sp. TaxID=173975 RepID=UPI0026051DBB|nr:radical SAM protein [uncultured Shewanella sp.]